MVDLMSLDPSHRSGRRPDHRKRDSTPGGLRPPGFFSFLGLGLGWSRFPNGKFFRLVRQALWCKARHQALSLSISRQPSSRSSSMTHAIRFHKAGGPEVLVWEEVTLG